MFRARLVACGYSQIPGVNFSYSHAPVINDVTYRVMLVCEIVYGLSAKIVDIETAFLHGDLEEEIYMECPEGLEHDDDECVLLQKTIYGLVQAARQFYKKILTVLKEIGFVQSLADPCLMVKRDKGGIVFVGIYVDDCYFLGNPKLIDLTVKQLLDKGFSVKIEDNLNDYLSCNILFNKEKTKAWMGQPHLLKNLEAKFGDLVKGLKGTVTPGTPGVGILRSEQEDPNNLCDSENQKTYRTGVGMLLYLVKHSRPDIANVTRELSKVIDKPTLRAFKELLRAIKFVLDTKKFGLKIAPDLKGDLELWTMTVYSDSEYGGDKDNRISVGGFIIFLLGVPILWRSRAQRSVTLSSAEAEMIACSEAAKEIRFVYQLLISMGIKIKTPIEVKVDNIGAIFMMENASTSGRTRHVDIRYHYVREYIEDDFIKIVFVRTKDNLSDEMTKNVTGDIYNSHVSEYMAEREAIVDMD